MIQLISELKGRPVILQAESAIVGLVEDYVIDPKDGNVEGILVREGFGKNNLKALPLKDIYQITSEFYVIKGYEALGELDEIIRIKNVLDTKTKILDSKVYTVSGKYLGKVFNYALDLKPMKLASIYVNKGLLSAFGEDKIIGLKQIVAIEPKRITVEDAVVLKPKTVKGKLAEPSL